MVAGMVSQADSFRAMKSEVQFGPEFAALLACCEGLAEAIDLKPMSPGLWGEYRMALERLLIAGDAEDGEATVLELMHSALGDAEDVKPAVRRSGGGGGREGSRAAVDAVAGTGRRRRSGTAS